MTTMFVEQPWLHQIFKISNGYTLDHQLISVNLSIWLVIQFTSNMFVKHNFLIIDESYKTNRINSCKTKSLKNVKEFFLLPIVALEIFALPKALALDSHWVKIMCNADFNILYSKNYNIWRFQQMFVYKIFKW